MTTEPQFGASQGTAVAQPRPRHRVVSRALARSVVLIPAYRPEPVLERIVDELRRHGFCAVVVVDDGSGAEYRPLFDRLEAPSCRVLRHLVNLGKGAALKTGLNDIGLRHPDADRVVTVDADGQHLVRDVVRVALGHTRDCRSLLVGSRRFSKDVPLRSRFGNIVTRHVFRWLVGIRLSDTQSGLRAIPSAALPWLLRIESTRYEFELDMLVEAHERGIPLRELPIRTVYEAGNSSSHFRPLVDSLRIYFVFLRYVAASFGTAAIDYAVFGITWSVTASVAWSMIASRLVAGIVQYELCRRAVFRSNALVTRSLPLFAALVVLNGLIGYALIQAWLEVGDVAVMLVKLVVEAGLFVVGFAVSRTIVFPQRRAP